MGRPALADRGGGRDDRTSHGTSPRGVHPSIHRKAILMKSLRFALAAVVAGSPSRQEPRRLTPRSPRRSDPQGVLRRHRCPVLRLPVPVQVREGLQRRHLQGPLVLLALKADGPGILTAALAERAATRPAIASITAAESLDATATRSRQLWCGVCASPDRGCRVERRRRSTATTGDPGLARDCGGARLRRLSTSGAADVLPRWPSSARRSPKATSRTDRQPTIRSAGCWRCRTASSRSR